MTRRVYATARNYAVATLVILVVFFTFAELATRTVSWISGKGFTLSLDELDPQDERISSVYCWHPFAGFTFTPGVIIRSGHPNQESGPALVQVDRFGFLTGGNSPLTREKSANEIRVATIGASTTANTNLAFDQNWPGRLGSLLQEAFPDKRFTVINAGVPGYNTAQSVGNLALRVMPLDPDIVIIYHAYNDLKSIVPGTVYKFDYTHLHTKPYGFREKPGILIRILNRSMLYVRARNRYREYRKEVARVEQLEQRLDKIPSVAAEAFRNNMRSLTGIAQAGGAKVVLSTFATLHDPGKTYSLGQTVSRLSRLKKNELYSLAHFTKGLTVDAIFEGIKTNNTIIRQIAKDMGTVLVNNAEMVPHEKKYFVDRVHFSAAGANRMAENLFPAVAGLLEP